MKQSKGNSECLMLSTQVSGLITASHGGDLDKRGMGSN